MNVLEMDLTQDGGPWTMVKKAVWILKLFMLGIFGMFISAFDVPFLLIFPTCQPKVAIFAPK